MAIITKITTQKKNKDRFNVFMDYGKGEEFALSVDSEVLIRFKLKKGLELDDFSFMEIQFQDDIRKAYNLGVNYLARRMRSEKEMKDYLVRKETEEPVIIEVLHKLTMQKYINDEEYAFSYVRTQKNTTDKGPNLILQELKEKGIDQKVIQLALEEYSIEEQVEMASKVSEKLFQKNTSDSQRILKQKVEQLLLRKGYPFDIINIAVQKTEPTKELDDIMEAIKVQGERAHRKFQKYSGYEYKQKMKQALYRKGFAIELIENFLEEIEES